MAPRRRRGADAAEEEPQPESDAPKNKPPNTAFRQQRMKAWQCVLTPKLIVTIFSILAAIYLGFGAYLTYVAHTVRDPSLSRPTCLFLHHHMCEPGGPMTRGIDPDIPRMLTRPPPSQVRDLTIDYTECVSRAPNDTFGAIPKDLITAHFGTAANQTLDPYAASWKHETRNITYHPGFSLKSDICIVQFNIPEDLKPGVLFYYYLENFYQNHRRYVSSFNAKQLLGDAVDGSTINSSTCEPVTHSDDGKIIYPCGIIANSMFNDTFSSPVLLNTRRNNNASEVYEMQNNTGIVWPGLRDLYGDTQYKLDQIAPPPNWRDAYPNGSYSEAAPPPNLKEWEAFQNWMMLAASPNFYKLYQRNDKDVMFAGRYQVDIKSIFDTNLYNGRKSFVITTLSTMGSRNIWPGIIFLIVGGICLILDVYFILSFFLWKPRKLGDPSYLSWNQPQAPAPAAHSTS